MTQTSPSPQRLFRSNTPPAVSSATSAARTRQHSAPAASRGTHRLWRGRPEDPAWVRPALFMLLAGTALLYTWDLAASGWANSFYAAAVQAGTVSWKAFFFGSSDASNFITVDKTPLSLWPMELAARVFGLNSWTLLVPQAIEGVATVGVLYATVRRATCSSGAGLLAGLGLALTPVAALMFRFDNPDAMLVLLLTSACWATLRALESPRALRWLALAGALVGLGFLAKMLQAFLVLPALALVYLMFARTSWGKRLGHLLVAFVSMVVAGGWWVVVASLWPAADRPYIGGSQTNSVLELTLGYNGLGRLTGNETGSVGGQPTNGGGGMWGSTGITRLLGTEVGGQIAWLIPAAILLGVAALFFARERLTRAALVTFGGVFLVTGLTFSFMAGIFHSYYTVALAPAIAALVATGAVVLWRRRDSLAASALLGMAVVMTAAWSFHLLGQASGYLPWLRWSVLVLGILAGALVTCHGILSRNIAALVAAVAIGAGLAGPSAYSVSTATTPHTGSIVSAGPASAQSGPGGHGGPGGMRGPAGMGGTRPTGMQPPAGATGQMPQGTQPPTGMTGQGNTGQAPTGTQGSGNTHGTMPGGGAGNLLNGSTSSSAIDKLLRQGHYTWAAAAIGSNTASGYQLGSGKPVMAIGGFNGSDPSPTLAQFKSLVAQGRIHWFIASGDGAGGLVSPGGSSSSGISTWVQSHFTKHSVDGVTLYDLTSPKTSGSAS